MALIVGSKSYNPVILERLLSRSVHSQFGSPSIAQGALPTRRRRLARNQDAPVTKERLAMLIGDLEEQLL